MMSWLLEASDRLTDNICVNYRHTCGCTVRHTSNTLLPCVTSWESQKKSAKISGRELWTCTSLVHPWVQIPDAWRCQVHLSKQLYLNINTMGMSSHHITQEGDGFLRSMCFVGKCVSTPEQKQKSLWRCWLKLVKECHYPQWNESWSNMGWKATQRGSSHYSQSNIKKPDYSL